MLPGHYVTAHIAKQKEPRGHIAYFLVASQLPDFLWLVFHYLGLEPTAPDNFFVLTIQTLAVEMTYSHDLLPMLGWIGVTVVVGRLLFGAWRPGVVGGALVALHAITDYVGGYPHHLCGPDSVMVGTGLYYSAPVLAVALEAVFVVGVLAWVVRNDARAGVRRSGATLVVWALVYGGGTAFMFLSASGSLVELLGLELQGWMSNTTVPTLIALYAIQTAALVWADARPPRSSALSHRER